jgi:hypothetical protein
MRKSFAVLSFFVFSPVVILFFTIVFMSGVLVNKNHSIPFLKFDLNYRLFGSVPRTAGLDEMSSLTSGHDARATLLRKFFSKYSSPLESHSDYVVLQADKYNIDYRLIPSIAMQESTGCKFIPDDSYNCWGYGIYGNNVLRFANYAEGVERVSRGLREDYYNHGLDTPQKIMRKYTPPSIALGGPWAYGVEFFFNQIEDPQP